MSYSRNFESVIAQADGTLRVDATSIDDETGEAGSKDPATAFHVALVKAPDGVQGHLAETVEHGVGGAWMAFLPGSAPAFADNPDVYVIGIASLPDGALDVWQERHTITSRTGKPFSA